MKKGYRWLFIATVILGMASCQKEIHGDAALNPGTPADTIPGTEVGDWKFISLQGTIAQTTEVAQSGASLKGVSNTNFTSQNNAGTLTFDSATMTVNGLALSINTTAKTYVYMNGFLIDSLQAPLTHTITPQSTTAGYQKIGADSLYFQDGGLLNSLTGGILPSAPTGCKLTFEGNTMKITVAYDIVTTQDYQGFPAKVTMHAVLVATLQRN
ncbi:hypothetical protein FAM09_24945 [Niastella caeni]|uniref:Uncharacterized protein n=1 Tax=Niastella caeni TaxID=2569763 RepID=A0A4S8HJ22_9BACT|nr:hypothetical protein [Niastella caeni]THU34269.1 hypothetical protein FAM09_24945 [Niastella caeni]